MLSTRNPDLRPQQHRRQNSTPTPIGNTKVSVLPAYKSANGGHRKGLSIDQSVYPRPQRKLLPQDDDKGNTNQGIHQRQQQNLREAQQQRIGQPGLQQQPYTNEYQEYQSTNEIQTTTNLEFDPGSLANTLSENQSVSFDLALSGLLNTPKTEDNQFYQSFGPSNSAGHLDGFGLGAEETNLHLLNSEYTNAQVQLDMQIDETLLQADIIDGLQRPCTPLHQTNTSYFPITPGTTPFPKASVAHNAANSRTAYSSPLRRDPNGTIKAPRAVPLNRGHSAQVFVEEMMQQSRTDGLPSPPATTPSMKRFSADLSALPTPDFMNMASFQMDFSTHNGGDSSLYSPMSHAISASPAMSSFQSSPEMQHMTLFPEIGSDLPQLTPSYSSNHTASQSAIDLGSLSSPMQETLQPRSQSLSELDLEDAMIEDTGVTVDDIAMYIAGPDPVDGKWVCLYPDCRKKFGRKENIKSHVQTHLGDRQFRCNHCSKCFVRQHDLKRHAKTHTGIKPYLCPCGAGFARHDALTRHRQRDLCVGALSGTPKRPIKKGRPKKTNRPDAETRMDKAARTRRKVNEQAYASSISGSSECSYHSPLQYCEGMEIRGTSPFDETSSLNPPSYELSTDVFSYTPPLSPGYSTGNCVSPQHTQHSHTPKALSRKSSPSLEYIAEESHDLPTPFPTPAKGSGSKHGTPELEPSSSSPLASKFFDFESSSGGIADCTDPSSAPPSEEPSSAFDLPIHDIDRMLQFWSEADPLSAVERDHKLLTDKFDNAFSAVDSWTDEFTHESQAFFDT